jgi:hypothetical protein
LDPSHFDKQVVDAFLIIPFKPFHAPLHMLSSHLPNSGHFVMSLPGVVKFAWQVLLLQVLLLNVFMLGACMRAALC